MSELNDPLARIGARLIAAAQTRRRRRRQHLQRAAGAALTLLLIVAAAVLARPFDGGEAPTPAGDGQVRSGDLTIWATERGILCGTRPGTTTCASAKQLRALLQRTGTILWPRARVERGRTVITGVVPADADHLTVTPQPSARDLLPRSLRSRGTTEPVPPAFSPQRFDLTGPTVSVPLHGRRVAVLRPFTVSIPHRTSAVNVMAVPRDGEAHLGSYLQVGDAFVPTLQGSRLMTFRTPAGSDAAAQVERTQLRLDLMLRHGAQVTGERDLLHVEVPRPTRLDDIRDALKPGRVETFDWEESALLPDDTTVASGLVREVPRARSISSGAHGSTGLTFAAARDQLRRQHGTARIVQSIGPFVRGEPLRRDDPRARFYVVRGTPALTGAEGVVVRPIASSGEVHPHLRFEPSQRGALRRATRTLARRGQQLARPGTTLLLEQHLAVVLDDRLMTLAVINGGLQPDGLVGDDLLLPDWFVRRGLRGLTDKLSTGPLPPLTEVR